MAHVCERHDQKECLNFASVTVTAILIQTTRVASIRLSVPMSFAREAQPLLPDDFNVDGAVRCDRDGSPSETFAINWRNT